MSDTRDKDSVRKPGEPQPWRPDVSGTKAAGVEKPEERPKEYGGRKGLDPTRYGDWEKNGRCIDF